MQRVRSALTRSFPAWTRGPACSTSSASGSRIGWRLGSPTCDVSTPPDGAFDLIWCEGAIYNVGFEAGLRAWRRLLVRGGRRGYGSVLEEAQPARRMRGVLESRVPG